MNAVAEPTLAESVLLRADADGVATLTMNRPVARNALSRELIAALQAELDIIANDASVRVVVIAGAGPAFSAGHDLKEVLADRSEASCDALMAACSRMMLSINRLPQPVIAKVHGTATAAGCQLVATCDLALAAEQAKFATPGVNIGLFCSTPMVPLSRAVGRKSAMRMLLTGDMIDAATAEAIGLVNEVVPEAELDGAVDELAAKIAGKSAAVLALGKQAFYRQLEMNLADAYGYASGVMTRNMQLEDAAEGIGAFVEKRPPAWRDR